MKQIVRKVTLLTATAFFLLLTTADAQRYRYSHRSYGRVPYYAPGPRYSYIPHNSLSITFGGYPYYYSSGIYYRHYGSFYRPVFPPIGLRIGILPVGYMPVMVGPNPYYFYEGTYYRRYNDKSYEVVDAPMGAQLSTLPKGAKSVNVNGEKFYELNGTYYKEDRDSKGNTVYTVTGKNGNINNSDLAAQQPGNDTQLRVGDKVNMLPENSRTITINGQKTFISPDNTYYQQESDGTYTVVGIEGN